MSALLRVIWWLPLIELAGLIWVGSELGILFVLFWTVGSFLWGGSLLAGPARIETLQRALHAGQDELEMMADQLIVTLAGICLIIPGFLTDALGLFLLLPWTRQRFYRNFLEPLVIRMQVPPVGPHDPFGGTTVDGDFYRKDRQRLFKEDD
ncbi:MAG: hypothetical protein D6758_12915 [Gammaproteobacteria bacterium]|nr:MAG: hypothetical protein D6758_12915 [Gammaproteobacteria bacterium]